MNKKTEVELNCYLEYLYRKEKIINSRRKGKCVGKSVATCCRKAPRKRSLTKKREASAADLVFRWAKSLQVQESGCHCLALEAVLCHPSRKCNYHGLYKASWKIEESTSIDLFYCKMFCINLDLLLTVFHCCTCKTGYNIQEFYVFGRWDFIKSDL